MQHHKGNPPRKANNLQCSNSSSASDSSRDSGSETPPLNNMVEIFQLSSDEYQGCLDKVLDDHTEKPAPKYNIKINRSIINPAEAKKMEEGQHEMILNALFPWPAADASTSSD